MAFLKSRTATALLALIILGFCLLAYYFAVSPETSSGASQPAPSANTPVIHGTYAFEAQDKKALVGASQNVFVGRVLEKVGAKGEPDDTSLPGADATSTPATQFSVEVIKSIKGNLDGTVTVSQHGGYGPDGQAILLEEDPLFEPGSVYVIATNPHTQDGWQQVMAQPFGKTKAKDATDRAKLEREFEEAKANQIPFDRKKPQGPPNRTD